MTAKYEAVLQVFESINGEALRNVSSLRMAYGDGYETLTQCWESAIRFAGALQDLGAADAVVISCQLIGG